MVFGQRGEALRRATVENSDDLRGIFDGGAQRVLQDLETHVVQVFGDVGELLGRDAAGIMVDLGEMFFSAGVVPPLGESWGIWPSPQFGSWWTCGEMFAGIMVESRFHGLLLPSPPPPAVRCFCSAFGRCPEPPPPHLSTPLLDRNEYR